MKATLDQNQLTPANLNQFNLVRTWSDHTKTTLAKPSQVKLVQTELDVIQLGQDTSNQTQLGQPQPSRLNPN